MLCWLGDTECEFARNTEMDVGGQMLICDSYVWGKNVAQAKTQCERYVLDTVPQQNCSD